MTHGLGSTLSKNVSSLALTIWELWYFKDLEEKKELVSQLINKWVTRLFVEQASATPGLLIILNNFLVLVFLLSAICFFPVYTVGQHAKFGLYTQTMKNGR